MIVLSNPNAQVIPAGQSAIFTIVLLHTGCGECHRSGSSSVELTGKNAIYEVSYNSNIGATAEGEAQLAVTLLGSPLVETTAISTTAAAGDLNNVSSGTQFKTCCCGYPGSIMLTNTGTTDINMGTNPRISVMRLA